MLLAASATALATGLGAIPVFLLRTVAQTELPPHPEWGFVFAYFGGAFAVFALGAVAARLLFARSGAAPAIFGIGACFSNTTILGIPIVLRAFGDAAAVPLALILGFHSALLFTLTTVVAEVGAGVGVPLYQPCEILTHPGCEIGPAVLRACHRPQGVKRWGLRWRSVTTFRRPSSVGWRGSRTTAGLPAGSSRWPTRWRE